MFSLLLKIVTFLPQGKSNISVYLLVFHHLPCTGHYRWYGTDELDAVSSYICGSWHQQSAYHVWKNMCEKVICPPGYLNCQNPLPKFLWLLSWFDSGVLLLEPNVHRCVQSFLYDGSQFHHSPVSLVREHSSLSFWPSTVPLWWVTCSTSHYLLPCYRQDSAYSD